MFKKERELIVEFGKKLIEKNLTKGTSRCKDLPNAFSKAEEIEFCAEIYCRTKSLGEPKLICDAEVDKLINLFHGFGQVKVKE